MSVVDSSFSSVEGLRFHRSITFSLDFSTNIFQMFLPSTASVKISEKWYDIP